jgi:hypothetical protein
MEGLVDPRFNGGQACAKNCSFWNNKSQRAVGNGNRQSHVHRDQL